MDYRIEEKSAIKCVGKIYKIPKGVDVCSNSWNLYLDVNSEKDGKTPNEVIAYTFNLDRAPLWQVGLSHSLEDGSVEMSIGAEAGDGEYPCFDLFEIPAATWAMFKGKGKVYEGYEALYTKIHSEWFPSSGYEQSMQYTVEIYPPGDAGSDDYEIEIWIPVKKK